MRRSSKVVPGSDYPKDPAMPEAKAGDPISYDDPTGVPEGARAVTAAYDPDDPTSRASSVSSGSDGGVPLPADDTPLSEASHSKPDPILSGGDDSKLDRKPITSKPEADPASLSGTVMTSPNMVKSIMLAISQDLDMNARGVRKAEFWIKGVLTPGKIEDTGRWAKTERWFGNRLPWAHKKYSKARYRYSPGPMFNEEIRIDKVKTTYLDNGNGLTGDEKREPIYKAVIHTTFSLKKVNEQGDNYIHDKDIKVFIEVDSQKGTLSFKSAEYGKDARTSQALLIHMAHFAKHAIDKTKNNAIRVDLKLPKVDPSLKGKAKISAEAARADMIRVMKEAIEGMVPSQDPNTPTKMLKADFLKLLSTADKIALGYEKDPKALNSASVDIMNDTPPATAEGSGANAGSRAGTSTPVRQTGMTRPVDLRQTMQSSL